MFDTYCGLKCEGCSFIESHKCPGCISTEGNPFHGSCPVAECAKAKGKAFCGECEDIPCQLLRDYSFDPVHGDNGERIKNCLRIKAALDSKK